MIFLFSRDCSASLLKDAKNLVKQFGFASCFDISKELTKRKIMLKCNETYYNNMFRFCRKLLNSNAPKGQLIHEFNQMLNFIESCDLIKNCSSFVSPDTKVLSDISKLDSGSDDFDLALLSAAAVSPDQVVLSPEAMKLFAAAKAKNIPVYAVSSIFSIDVSSVYHPGLCFENSLFDGIISEYGFESFSSFMSNARSSFPWLFF